jgi:MFS family permease
VSAPRLAAIPRGISALGLVSLCMDLSSELIHALLPLYLAVGLGALIAADLVLAAAGGGVTVFAGAALWGLHMGLTQGLLAALVAGAAPADLRGTAFGVFNLVCGIALLIASALAGWLWDAYGPAFTFGAGAAFTALAWLGLWRYGTAAARLPGR